ncbi:lipase/serine esteras-like protein [Aulographum hederae CBS 113979]|uniref:Lipase/serine esteras-like protein n=1 Tax=Aulographum hederae CBS 113979 TaxID=1176131 RepID=A0A6G1GSS1_9PEZI|nr:lipase/serine esteras-like protein [Aulographum hederae CBS 113979]
MEDRLGTKSADHLAVLIHGLWGNPNHLRYLADGLRERYSEDKLHILVAKRNSGSFTYDGIELGGERVAKEIEETLEQLARDGTTVKKMSIIGYSLGGLVARYTIGLLYHKGWFEEGKLTPVNFTTFASPHLGVRTPLIGFHNHLWNVLGARTLSTSGRQLFTIDQFRDTGKPLLSVLADPSSPFIHGLARFQNRTLYSNVVNDRSAVYYTTCISKTDPFVDPSAFRINYLPDYEPVILDSSNPLSPKDEESLPAFYKRLTVRSRSVLTKIPTTALLVILIPIGVVLFLINSGVQSVRSWRRIRLHEEGKAGIGAGMYRIPLMVENVRRTAEDMFENVNNTQDQEYLPTGSEPISQSPPSSPKGIPRTFESEEKDGASDDQPMNAKRPLEFPTLALTPDQFAMIEALDDVGFKKFPVYIHKARHSHAAIIRRMDRESFEEGKVVARHWLNTFEI